MRKTLKSNLTIFSLILLLIASVIFVTVPTINAQAPTKATYAFLGATPNPVGINQEVLLHVGIFTALASTELGYENLTITVTTPTGSVETLGPFRTDSTGGTGTLYIPSMVGTYTLQSHFPEQEYPATSFFLGLPAGTIMQASNSEIVELIVQQDPVAEYPVLPLPNEYWTRPIDAQIREWSTVSGSWLLQQDYNLFTPYNDGPETSHILWAKQMTTGGLAGGDMGQQGMECGDAYEAKFNDPVIINGRLYYRDGSTSDRWQRVVCVDIHTGEEIWRKTLLDNRTVAFAQHLYYDTYNYHGVFDYLWVTVGSTWHAFDPFNGDLVYTMTNVPGGTPVFGPSGEILKYNLNTGQGWMTLWNSSNVPGLWGGDVGYTAARWRPQGKTVDATGPCPVTPTTPDGIAGYMWNVSIPTGLVGNPNRVLKDKIIGTDIGLYGWVPRSTPIAMWAISTEPGEEGELLFNINWQPPAGNLTIGFATASLDDNVFVMSAKETRQFWGFNLNTGHEIWGPTDSQHYMDAYQINYGTNFPPPVWGYGVTTIAYGKLYCSSWGGIVYAYDVTTGDLEWTYNVTDPYNEVLFSTGWGLRTLFIADGKIYLGHEEHSPVDPKPRAAPFVCLNVTNGEEVWRINGAFRQTEWGGRAIIGDSIIATQDTYDQRVYGIGKGPSAITLSTPDNAAVGSTLNLKGTITDVSPGTQDLPLKFRFPNGVPAVSDESMSDWMLYVYKQFPRPTDTVGVEVRIQTVDPSGNYAWIGTATSDAYGNYAYSFIPQMKGTYTIIATFVGSGGYYGSQQTAYITVDPAPAQVTIPPYPGYQGPSAQEVANSVAANLPADATPQEVAQAVVNAMPDYPEPQEIPEYTTMEIVLAILVVIAIVIGLVLLFRKK